MDLTVTTWLWGEKFSLDDVKRLALSVRRNLLQPHRFICLCDRAVNKNANGLIEYWPIPDIRLTEVKGCFARLRMFDPAWQEQLGVTDRLVNFDLDTVVTGQLGSLFDRPEPFCIMQGGNASNPCPYNGALIMLRKGAHPEVWSDFTLEKAAKVPFYAYPDDQGWIWHKVPHAAGWRCGSQGVYVFRKPGWHASDQLPADARLVTFINNTPSKLQHLDWVQEHWR